MSAWTVLLILVSWAIVWFLGAMWGTDRGYIEGYKQAKRIWAPRASQGERDEH